MLSFNTTDNNDYKKNNSLDKRKAECQRIICRYINHVPVIVTYNDELGKYNLKKKFLVPNDVSCGHLIYTIRKNIKVNSSIAIFIFCNNVLISGTKNMSEIYDQYKEEDGFLYLYVATENTFG